MNQQTSNGLFHLFSSGKKYLKTKLALVRGFLKKEKVRDN